MKNKSITFLGTGTSQGIPVPGFDHPVGNSTNKKDKRLRTSALVQIDNTSIVIDCGPDFRYQMLRENVQNVDALLFTHEHSDHIAGIDDIRPYYFKRGSAMPFYAQERVLKSIEERFPYIFVENKYPGAPSVDKFIIENDNFKIENIEIIPIKVMHGNLDIIGFRIGDMAYITDANMIPEEELVKLKNLDILIINALRHEKHHSHFSLQESIEISKTIAPKKTYFTHISMHLGFHDEVEKTLAKNFYLAYDGLKLYF